MACSKARAFSLLEVLLATAILATGLLALYAAMTYGTRANSHGRRLSQATFAGREMLSLIKGRNLAKIANPASLSDPPGSRRPLDAPPFENDMQAYAQSDLKRNLVVRRLSNVNTSFDYEIVSLKVTLYWSEGSREVELPLETYDRI